MDIVDSCFVFVEFLTNLYLGFFENDLILGNILVDFQLELLLVLNNTCNLFH
jgi:hypothetical protein